MLYQGYVSVISYTWKDILQNNNKTVTITLQCLLASSHIPFYASRKPVKINGQVCYQCMTGNNQYYYTLHHFLLYKSNKTIWMFSLKICWWGNNLVDNPNIYNVEGDNKLSPGLQQVVALSTIPDNQKCVENTGFFSVWLCNCRCQPTNSTIRSLKHIQK